MIAGGGDGGAAVELQPAESAVLLEHGTWPGLGLAASPAAHAWQVAACGMARPSVVSSCCSSLARTRQSRRPAVGAQAATLPLGSGVGLRGIHFPPGPFGPATVIAQTIGLEQCEQ